MRVIGVWCACLLFVVCSVNGAAAHAQLDENAFAIENRMAATADPLDAARLVPQDVAGFLTISDSGHLFRSLATSNLAPGIRAAYERSVLGQQWQRFCNNIGADPETLAVLMMQGRVIIVMEDHGMPALDSVHPDPQSDRFRVEVVSTRDERSKKRSEKRWNDSRTSRSRQDDSGATTPDRLDGTLTWTVDPSGPHWIVVAEMETTQARKVVKALDTHVVDWIDDVAVHSSRTHERLCIAVRDGWVYLSANEDTEPRFRQLVARSFEDSLADDPEFERAFERTSAHVAFFSRANSSPESTASWHAASIHIRPSSIYVRALEHDARRNTGTERTGQQRDFTEPLNVSALELQNAGNVATVIERFTAQPDDSIGSMMLLAPFIERQPDVLRAAGPTMFTTISTVDNQDESPLRPHESDESKLSAVWGIELRPPSNRSARQIDSLLMQSLKALRDCHPDPEQISLPDEVGVGAIERVQSVDLTACARPLIEAVPGLDQLELHWSVARGPQTEWWLCSTDRSELDRVAQLLTKRRPMIGPPGHDAIAVIDGAGAVSLLSDWPAVNSESPDPVWSRVFYVREFLRAIPRMSMTVTRVNENETLREIAIDLGL